MISPGAVSSDGGSLHNPGLVSSRTSPHLVRCRSLTQATGAVSAMLFRQIFDSGSATYAYLLAARRGTEALIIDPVLEKVDQYLRLIDELDVHPRAHRGIL